MNLYFNTSRSVFLEDTTLIGEVWNFSGGNAVPFESAPWGPILPSYPVQSTPANLTQKLSLGDGYEFVSETGIRSTRLEFEFVFNTKTTKVATALWRFFLGEGGNSVYNRRPSEWFYFLIPPGLPRAGEIRKFLAAPSGSSVGYEQHNLTVKFTESFQP